MNYIWDLLIQAQQAGQSAKQIIFQKSVELSPYMEINMPHINSDQTSGHIKINPYYRFYSIFKLLFEPNYQQNQEFRDKLLDLLIHFLGQIDKFQGMTKEEYYKNYILADIESGIFGEKVKANFDLFSIVEKNIIAENIYKMYNTGQIIHSLKRVINKIYPHSNFYFNENLGNEILLYLDYERSSKNVKKIDLIKQMFLPFEFRINAFWDFHFGVIDVYQTMRIGQTTIYDENEYVEWQIINKEE